MTKRTVILFGKSSLAVRVAEWLQASEDFSLLKVVPTRPHTNWTQDLGEWAAENRVPLIASGDIDEVNSQADLALSIYYNRVFKPHHISSYAHALNVHNSALPAHRGMRPIEWSLLDGSGEQGVTMHAIEPGIDVGAIYGQVRFKTWPHQSSHDVYELCLQYAFPMVTSVLTNLSDITPEPQDETRATYHYAHEVPETPQGTETT